MTNLTLNGWIASAAAGVVESLPLQDFELPDSDEPNLVNKILQYAGVSIRENDIAVFGKMQEQEDNQQQS